MRAPATLFGPLLRRNHSGLRGPDMSFRQSIQHIPLAQLEHTLHECGTLPVDTVIAHPAKRDSPRRRVGNYLQRQLSLGAEDHPRWYSSFLPTDVVIGPLLRQEQTTVHEGMSLGGAVVGEHGNLVVVGTAQRPGILSLDADRLGSLLGETRLVGVPDSVLVGEDLQNTVAHLAEDVAVRPDPGGDERLERSHWPAKHRLSDVLGIVAFPATKKALDETARVSLIAVRAEERSETVKEAIEFGLQCQKLLLIHERPPGDG
jgi:hypothetical protein